MAFWFCRCYWSRCMWTLLTLWEPTNHNTPRSYLWNVFLSHGCKVRLVLNTPTVPLFKDSNHIIRLFVCVVAEQEASVCSRRVGPLPVGHGSWTLAQWRWSERHWRTGESGMIHIALDDTSTPHDVPLFHMNLFCRLFPVKRDLNHPKATEHYRFSVLEN